MTSSRVKATLQPRAVQLSRKDIKRILGADCRFVLNMAECFVHLNVTTKTQFHSNVSVDGRFVFSHLQHCWLLMVIMCSSIKILPLMSVISSDWDRTKGHQWVPLVWLFSLFWWIRERKIFFFNVFGNIPSSAELLEPDVTWNQLVCLKWRFGSYDI